MLILRSTNTLKRGSIWRPGAAFAIVCDDAEIGRIEINGAPEKDGAARISLRERSLECRIHRTSSLDLRSCAMGDVFRGYRAA